MPMNRVQFQPGLSMPEFLQQFGTGRCRHLVARSVFTQARPPEQPAKWLRSRRVNVPGLRRRAKATNT